MDVDDFVTANLSPADAQPEFLFDAATTFPKRLNAAVWLIDRAVMDGDGALPAIRTEDGDWTYAHLADVTDRIARVLVEEERLARGARVLLRGANSAWLYAAWAGVLKAGGVAVTTMPLLRAGEIEAVLRKAAIAHAIVEADGAAAFDEAAAMAGGVRSRLVYGARDPAADSLEARVAAAAPGFAAADTSGDDPALIAFTSGTTGEPKGCVHLHRCVLVPGRVFSERVLRPRRGDVWAGSPPIAFTFGLGGLVIFPWASCGVTVPIAGGGADALLDAVERHRVTTLFTAPTAYKAMLGRLDGRDISSLRTCVSAGEHLPAATFDAWEAATGLRLVNGIGATEMMHVFISDTAEDGVAGATGRALPPYRACVLDEDGKPLAEGTGRLAVKGPTGCRYLADARQTDYVRDGWNVTGDTYRLDADGRFWWLARSDDMIVSSGYNIAAPEVENALLAHAAVAECAVVGAADTERGTIVKAFVVAAPGWTADDGLARALQDHVKAAIAPYKYPRAVVFVDALPKTLTGKLRRAALREA